RSRSETDAKRPSGRYWTAGPMVRIHLPSGKSLRTSGPRGPTTPRPITLRSYRRPLQGDRRFESGSLAQMAATDMQIPPGSASASRRGKVYSATSGEGANASGLVDDYRAGTEWFFLRKS